MNGYKNEATFRVATILINDYTLYNIAIRYDSWESLRARLNHIGVYELDGVDIMDLDIDADEISELLADLKKENENEEAIQNRP